MARTESKMIDLGSKAFDFTLYSPIKENEQSLTALQSEKATLIIFMSNHCPFVKHLNSELSLFAKDFIPKGLSVIAINSNDILNYPDDSPENMKLQAEEYDFQFPYLFDETQEIAKEYGFELADHSLILYGEFKGNE